VDCRQELFGGHSLTSQQADSMRDRGMRSRAASAGVANSGEGECEQATAMRMRPAVRQDLAIWVGVLIVSWVTMTAASRRAVSGSS